MPITLTNNLFYHTFYTTSSANPSVMTRNIYNNIGFLQETIDISFGGMNVADVLRLMDGTGSNPYTLGLVDSAQNKICMDLAYSNVYTKSLTERQQNLVLTYANTTFKEPHTYANVVYTVTVSEGVYWLATGVGGVPSRKPEVILGVGSVYVFDQSHASNFGNPLRLTTTASAPSYDIGVVTVGTPGYLNAYTLIDVTASTSLPLYYYCTNTANMGPVPLLPIIQYTFEIVNGTTITNSGTAGTAGNGTIVAASGSTYTASHSTTKSKKGLRSIYNNILSTYMGSSYISFPSYDIDTDMEGFTFCSWLNISGVNAVSNVHHIFFRFVQTPIAINSLDIFCDGRAASGTSGQNKLMMNYKNDAAYNVYSGNVSRDLVNSWNHIAFTIKKSTKNVTMYLNGVGVGVFTATSYPTNLNTFQFINTNTAWTSLYGFVDDIRVYGGELTSADIERVYALPVWKLTGAPGLKYGTYGRDSCIECSGIGTYVLVSSNYETPSQLHLSTDGGINFSKIDGTGNLPLALQYYNHAISDTGQYMYTTSSSGYLWRSSNYGSTWSAVVTDTSTTVCTCSGIGDKVMSNGLNCIYFSTDHGINFTKVTITGLNPVSISISRNGNYWLYANNNNITEMSMSTDNCGTWTQIRSLAETPASTKVTNTGGVYFTNLTSNIYYYNNSSWNIIYAGTGSGFLKINASGSVLYAAVGGNLVYSFDNGISFSTTPVNFTNSTDIAVSSSGNCVYAVEKKGGTAGIIYKSVLP